MGSLDECDMCHGLRCHGLLKRNMNSSVEKHLKSMKLEERQLLQLLHKAYWYQFELVCKNWKEPWHESLLHSQIAMPNTAEGYWYIGSLGDAPPLPAAVLEVELAECRSTICTLKEISTAATDWAPGGDLYEKLLRESPMVHLYNTWHTKSKQM
jgi:hypothetical protein